MIVKLDTDGKTITIDPDTSLVRIDGIILCKKVEKCGEVYLQFKDGDRLRSRCRGTSFVEIPISSFYKSLTGLEKTSDK